MIDAYILMDIITDHNLCKTQKETLQSVIDKIESGTLIELPCKVGQVIYRIFPSHRQPIYAWVIVKVEVYEDEIVFEDDSGNKFKVDKIVKTIFLTREEAEKRLKELQNG